MRWKAVNPRRIGGVDSAGSRMLSRLLPPRCLVCGAPGDGGRDLCAGCAGDFSLNHPCCPRCALPLAAPAPMCGECVRRPPPFAAVSAPFRYAHPLDLLEVRFKFGGDLAAGRVLGEMLADMVDPSVLDSVGLLVAVPLHPARLRERGYNQALELARPLARRRRLPLTADALRRQRATPPQTGLDARGRRKNLADAFVVAPDVPLPRHVVLVDDVMTTGATLRECAQVLQRAGCDRVDAIVLARAPLAGT